jgi:hypothetical protein
MHYSRAKWVGQVLPPFPRRLRQVSELINRSANQDNDWPQGEAERRPLRRAPCLAPTQKQMISFHFHEKAEKNRIDKHNDGSSMAGPRAQS